MYYLLLVPPSENPGYTSLITVAIVVIAGQRALHFICIMQLTMNNFLLIECSFLQPMNTAYGAQENEHTAQESQPCQVSDQGTLVRKFKRFGGGGGGGGGDIWANQYHVIEHGKLRITVHECPYYSNFQ